MAEKLKIRKGDQVLVIAGKDRVAGRKGVVQEVHPKDGTVIVAGANIVKRHTKPNPAKREKGGIVEKPAPLAISKVMLICPHCNEPTRVGYRFEDRTKERFCKRCNEPIVVEKTS